MNLPIDVVANTNPPLFKWTQVVGGVVQQCEGMLPPSCESAVAALIEVARRALEDNVALRAKLRTANERADRLTPDKAKVPASPPPTNKK